MATISNITKPEKPTKLYNPTPNAGDRIEEREIALWVNELRTCLDTLTFDLILVKLDQKQEFLIHEKLCTPL